MSTKRRARRTGLVAAGVLAAALLAALSYVALTYDPPPLSAEAVRERVDRLNEGAAVQVPHFSLDDGTTRAKHLELFQRVEQGQVLSGEQSAQYRLVYQELLRRHQRRLRRFDRNLTVLPDVGMQVRNNVDGRGIQGSHDHHDESSRSNFRDLRDALHQLETDGSAGSVRHAIYAYKDLRDILLHLATAPQTKSILYQEPEAPPRDSLDVLFENVLREYKLAQFEAVNSPGYTEHVANALDSYDRLVLAVQERVYAHLSPLERTLAGTWIGWQSLSPGVGDFEPTRISRPRRTATINPET